MKLCKVCKIVKPFSEFYKDKTVLCGLRSYCKSCAAGRQTEHRARNPGLSGRAQKKWREKNLEKVKAQDRERYSKNRDRCLIVSREWQKKNPEKVLNAYLRREYGISVEDYKALLIKQKGVCAICKQNRGKRALAVDHCHLSGKVRGLLCGVCNPALGAFNDSQELLAAAIAYLQSP